MPAYKELDEAICAYIGTGSVVHPIYITRLTLHAAHELGPDVTEEDERVIRLIDRRLQALKKAGRLRYERPRWMLVQPDTVRTLCGHCDK